METENGKGNGDEMENENGDEDEGGDEDGDGGRDGDDLDQESAQVAAISLWWDDPTCDTAPGTGGLVSGPWARSGLQTRQPRLALSNKLSLGCTRGLHGVENINCGFLVLFLII